MLILVIKNGFDVIDTCIDKNGSHKIILEKIYRVHFKEGNVVNPISVKVIG